MTTQTINRDKTVAALVHLSTFSQFFFPFGNFIFPLIFWTAKKNDPFVSENAKRALNFQISLFLYAFLFMMTAVAGAILIGLRVNLESFYFNGHEQWMRNLLEATPILIYMLLMLLLLLSLLVLNIYAVVSATVKAGEGKIYKYPLTINFLGAGNISSEENEQPPTEEEK